ncbi:MAG TPA: hypothetical protein VGM03_04425 [Phycisphaerae bacterium]|jgi:hypothetical protein
MSWLFVALLLLNFHDPLEAGDPSVCRCETVRAGDGWCAKCRVGYYAGLRIESAELFGVLDLHGHQVSAEKTRCARCRELIGSGGYCDTCHMGFVNGRGFFSRVCYHLAQGRILTPGETRKPCCPHNNDWCPICNTGIVANRVFDDQRDFEDARRYYEVLRSAVHEAARCESCAMAMICDSRCPVCHIVYKDGKPVEPSGGIKTDRTESTGSGAPPGAASSKP